MALLPRSRGRRLTLLKAITPIVPVKDVEKSRTFFEKMLGFSTSFYSEDYAYLCKDNVGIRIIKAGKGVDTHDPRRQLSCYIDVEGIDALYAELEVGLQSLPKGRVRAPFNQDYGQREFHVIDEDSLLIFFGEPIK